MGANCLPGMWRPLPLLMLRLAALQVRQLTNGDVYKGTYGQAGLKVGEGLYHFANGDVYEGEFDSDRMQGLGVYTFATQGRFEGQVSPPHLQPRS